MGTFKRRLCRSLCLENSFSRISVPIAIIFVYSTPGASFALLHRAVTSKSKHFLNKNIYYFKIESLIPHWKIHKRMNVRHILASIIY